MEQLPSEIGEEQRESIEVETLLQYLEIMVKGRYLIITFFSVITISTLLYILAIPPIYVAKTTILPADPDKSSPLRGLAGASAQLMGFNLPTGGDFSLLYEPIAKSRRVITKVLKSSFNSSKYEKNVPLLDILEINAESIEERLDIGYRRFINEILKVDFDNNNGITTLFVGTIDPQLSADIAKSLVGEIDKYGREFAIGKAKENKVFIEERLSETLNLLEKAEGSLKVFRESNKRIEKSPELQLEQGRLIREVRVQEEVYLTLKKEIEIIKIEEVKSLPLLRVLDEAVAPIIQFNSRRIVIMGLAMILSLLFGIIVVFSKEYLSRLQENEKYSMIIKRITTPIIKDFNNLRRYTNRAKNLILK